MIRLVAGSEALHRTQLAFAHRVAGRVAGALDPVHGPGGPPPGAVVLADAMLAVVVRVVEALGAARDVAALPQIAADAQAAVAALRPLVAALRPLSVTRQGDTAG